MNRLCTRLRQRLTPEHLANALLVSEEGHFDNDSEIRTVIQHWNNQKQRRIVFPPFN